MSARSPIKLAFAATAFTLVLGMSAQANPTTNSYDNIVNSFGSYPNPNDQRVELASRLNSLNEAVVADLTANDGLETRRAVCSFGSASLPESDGEVQLTVCPPNPISP